MKLGKGVPSVWPGYVAAVASLVLSLLLLLAILVFAMTQVENMVARYEQEILRASLLAEAAGQRQGPGKAPSPALPAPSPGSVAFAHKPAQVASAAQPPSAEHEQLRLIFEAGVAEIGKSTASEMAAAVQQMQGYQQHKWHVTAQTLQTDPVMEKSTYRLMLLVRQVLRAQNVDEKNIEITLRKTAQAPMGYERGEIVIQASLIKPMQGAPK